MAKKLKVLTPQTVDGRNLSYDEDKNVIYKESIVELSSKADFEALNASLPTNLKHKLEEIEVDEAQVIPMAAIEKKEATEDEKDKEIAELKKKLEAATAAAKPVEPVAPAGQTGQAATAAAKK